MIAVRFSLAEFLEVRGPRRDAAAQPVRWRAGRAAVMSQWKMKPDDLISSSIEDLRRTRRVVGGARR